MANPTPTHTSTPPTAGGSPETLPVPATVARAEVGPAAPRNPELTVGDMMKTPKFPAFLGKAFKGIPFNPENSPAETKKFYDAFKASERCAPAVKEMLARQVAGEKGGFLAAQDIVRINTALEQIAAQNPESVTTLEQELQNIRAFPERKRQMEAEYQEQVMQMNTLRQQLQELSGRRTGLQESLEALPAAAPAATGVRGFLKNVGTRITNVLGRITAEQKRDIDEIRFEEELAELDTAIQGIEQELATGMLTADQRQQTIDTQFRAIESSWRGILGSIAVQNERGERVSVLEEARKGLSNGINKRFAEGLLSEDIMVVAKIGQDFRHFTELQGATGADYLSGEVEVVNAAGAKQKLPFDAAKFATALTERLEGKSGEPGLLEKTILKALSELSGDLTETRMEVALGRFITLTSEGIGVKSKSESIQMVIDIFAKAHDKAIAEGDETGKAPLLALQISKLLRLQAGTLANP